MDEVALRGLASWLTSWSWPVTRQRALELAEEHGWTVAEDSSESIVWDTELPPGSSATVLDGVVADVMIRTSARVDDDAAGRRQLRNVFAEQVAAATAELGPPTQQSPGARPSATWELADGSAVKIGASSRSCYWVLTSPKFVEVQRDLGRGA